MRNHHRLHRLKYPFVVLIIPHDFKWKFLRGKISWSFQIRVWERVFDASTPVTCRHPNQSSCLEIQEAHTKTDSKSSGSNCNPYKQIQSANAVGKLGFKWGASIKGWNYKERERWWQPWRAHPREANHTQMKRDEIEYVREEAPTAPSPLALSIWSPP